MKPEVCGLRHHTKLNLEPRASIFIAQAYIVIHCETGMEEWVIRNLKKIEGVTEVSGVYSLYDIIAKVEAKDSVTLENIITKQIRKLQYIHTTMTLLVIN